MVKVLHIVRSLNAGGIGTFILNVYEKIDKNKYQFDFAVTSGNLGEYGEKILELGGNIYFISDNYNKNIKDALTQMINLYKLLKKEKYDILHSHYYFANAYFLAIAKMCGVKKRISHCHNTRTKKIGTFRKVFEALSQKLLFITGTDYLACSYEAAVFLYGKKAIEKGKGYVLYNGIDYNKWNLDKLDINILKKKYDIKKEKVLIFVGRMEEQKNPLFALEIILKLYKKEKKIKFFMIGEGSLLEDVKKYIDEKEMDNYVTLFPATANVIELQAISSIMIAPSLWEGLSIAYIEAQKMKTLVVASDSVPNEVNMGYCEFISLSDPELWEEKIFNHLKCEIKQERKYNENYKLFNIDKTIEQIEQVYLIK